MEIKLKPKQASNPVAQFIDCLLVARNVVHKKHWNVTGVGSYSQHKALNKLYDILPEFADNLAEKFQGYNGELLPIISQMSDAELIKKSPLELAEWILKYVIEYRKVFGDNSMLQNIIDELVGELSSIKYKLQFLQ